MSLREWINVALSLLLPIFLMGSCVGWIATELSYGADYRAQCMPAAGAPAGEK